MSSFCSLQEAHGEDFYRQVNNDYGFNKSYLNNSRKNLNPTRFKQYHSYNNNSRENLNGIQSSRIPLINNNRNLARKQSDMDLYSHRNSFNSIGIPPLNDVKITQRAWGDIDDLDPREVLKKSLLRDRIINSDRVINSSDNSEHKNFPGNGEISSEPKGFNLQLNNSYKFKRIKNHNQCDNFFYHLDSCRKCQRRLKKRIKRYLKTLKKYQEKEILPNSTYNPESELFIDSPEDDDNSEIFDIHSVLNSRKIEKEDDKSKKKEIEENFVNPNKIKTEPAFLLFFGLFIIFMMDSSKNAFIK